MRRGATRGVAALVLLLAAGAGSTFAIEAAAVRAGGVDVATLRVDSVGASGASARSSVRRLPLRADLLGASWRGSADAIELRAQGSDGRWSQWVELSASADGPDPGGAEARAAARRLGAQRTVAAPLWVGDAERVQVRSHEREVAHDVRVVAINATGTATRAERAAGTLQRGAAWVLGETQPSAAAMPGQPGIRSRASWNATEPRSTPALAGSTGVLGAVVHHTAGTNRYSCSQVPALLRGIQRYHMQSNGWNDIGYNFLVDACGGVWEGRAGGTTRPVIGAHTAGFNTSTTGIALIGTHSSVRPSAKARAALQRLLAWRLDVAHVKPTTKMALTARTNDKFANGSRVVVRAVSGHRDLYPTSCPGAMGYRELGSLAQRAWLQGGAKVANITRSWVLANPDDPHDPTLRRVNVRAIASSPDMYMSVQLRRASTGEVLHQHGASGLVIATTWHAPAGTRVPVWDVRVVVNGARTVQQPRRVRSWGWQRVPGGGWRRVVAYRTVQAASGVQRARRATLVLQHVAPDPGLVISSPPSGSVVIGGDPADDLVRLQYTLAQDYRLGAWLHDPSSGEQLATLLPPEYVAPTATPRDLELAIPASVPAGSYELRVGLPADDAVGRSMHRSALTISR